MKAVWIILLIIIAYPIYLGVSRMTVEERYGHAAQRHLEKKYGGVFFVEPQAQDPRDKLLPHITFPPTSYFYAYRLSDPENQCEVYITKSKFSYRIQEITDTYYFQFLRLQLQDYVHQEFKEVLGDEMKVNVAFEGEGLSNKLNHNSTLDDFFAVTISDGRGIHSILDEYDDWFFIDLTIYIPEYDAENQDNITQQAKNFSLRMLQQHKVLGDIGTLYVKDREIYNLIDVSQDFTWRDQEELFGKEENVDLLEAVFYNIHFIDFLDAVTQEKIKGEGDDE